MLSHGCGPMPYIPNAQERWVRDQVNAGRTADLPAGFPREPNMRVLRGEFIEALLCETVLLPKVRPPRGHISIKNARINGRINLDGAELAHELTLSHCELPDGFSGRRSIWGKPLTILGGVFGEVDFEGADFRDTLVADSGTFRGPVCLTTVRCRRKLSFERSEFQDPSGRVACESMSVEGDAYFTNVKMSGPVSFARSQFTGMVDLYRAQFLDPNSETSFAGVSVGGDFGVREAVFSGGVTWYGASIAGDLVATGCTFGSGQGRTSFRMASIGGTVDFKQATFVGAYDLGGMEYKDMVRDEGDDRWGSIIELLSAAQYAPEAYARLVEHLHRLGCPAEANRVYIESKRRERRECTRWGEKGLNWVFDVTIRYGRDHWRAFWIWLIIVFSGMVVFRKKNMISRTSGGAGLKYCALWYSLDLCLPVVNLQMKADWMPKQRCCLVRYWLLLHLLLGWFFLTVWLLGLTGVIK